LRPGPVRSIAAAIRKLGATNAWKNFQRSGWSSVGGRETGSWAGRVGGASVNQKLDRRNGEDRGPAGLDVRPFSVQIWKK